MKYLSFIAIFLLFWANTIAEDLPEIYTQTVRGTILDKHSQTPLIGATVIIINSDPLIGTVSDINGEFKITNVPIGRQSIKVSFIGYHPALINNIELTSGKELILNIQLEEQVIRTEEVVVKAHIRKDKALNEMAAISARSFSIEETERYAGSLGDPSRMVSNYAGVSMVNDQRNDIIIRGNSPAGLLWRLDGIEIPNPNHFGSFGTTGGPVSMLNNNLLTNSDFFTGAFPAEYGNATSGVFDLNMRSGNNQKREYVGQIGFNGFEFGAEGPFKNGGKASYLANFRYSTLEVFHYMGFDIGVGAAIPQYKDLTFKLDFPGTRFGRFSIVGLGGTSFIALHDSDVSEKDSSDNKNYNYPGTDLDYGSDMGIVGLTHLYYFDDNTKIETQLSVLGTRATTYIDSLRFDTSGAIIPNSNFKFYESVGTEIKYSMATHFQKKINVQNILKTGIYFDSYRVDYLDSAYVDGAWEQSLNYKGNISLIRPYIQYQYRYNDNLTFNAGIYSQYVDLNNEISIEPRLSMKYQFAGQQAVSFGYGLHSQLQPRLYYFIQTELNNGEYILTNTDLKMSKAHHFVIGYDKLLNENMRLKSEVYYQSLFNVPVVKNRPEFSVINSGDSFYSMIYDSLINEGVGSNYGLELTLEKFLSNGYYFLGTLSLFESKYKGYDEVQRNTTFNNNYVINILGGYEFRVKEHNKITIDVKTVYSGGKRYLPVDVNATVGNDVEYKWNEAFDNRYGDYFRFDLRIGFKMNKKKFNQEWALDLQNLTNHKNIYAEEWNPRTKDLSRVYQNGFYPMMLWRIQF